MEKYLKKRIADLKTEQIEIRKNISELEAVLDYDAEHSPVLNYNIGAIKEAEKTLNYYITNK